jgi:hypothetical protein
MHIDAVLTIKSYDNMESHSSLVHMGSRSLGRVGKYLGFIYPTQAAEVRRAATFYPRLSGARVICY